MIGLLFVSLKQNHILALCATSEMDSVQHFKLRERYFLRGGEQQKKVIYCRLYVIVMFFHEFLIN